MVFLSSSVLYSNLSVLGEITILRLSHPTSLKYATFSCGAVCVQQPNASSS